MSPYNYNEVQAVSYFKQSSYMGQILIIAYFKEALDFFYHFYRIIVT